MNLLCASILPDDLWVLSHEILMASLPYGDYYSCCGLWMGKLSLREVKYLSRVTHLGIVQTALAVGLHRPEGTQRRKTQYFHHGVGFLEEEEQMLV